MDTATLRVAFAVLALTMLVLFYLISYRSTRSEFCGWWCASLALFLAGSSAYLLDGSSQQVWANPLGNVLIVGGGVSVWNGTRSLRAAVAPLWVRLLAPLVVGVASVLDHPSDNDWSGGTFFLAAMALTVGAASRELWVLQRETAARIGSAGDLLSDRATYLTVLRAMAITSSVFSVFYVARCVAFVAVGPEAEPFTTVFGSQVTTLLTSVLLATVSFSMSSMSNEQQTGELRLRASTDGLSGLLNRTTFTLLAVTALQVARRRAVPVCVVVADIDHFKDVNDQLGHSAGDEAVRRVAQVCRAAVRESDVVGRLGGDEFVLLLPGASEARARQVAQDVRSRLARTGLGADVPRLTLSFGIALVDPATGLDDALARADAALYRAKDAGRDRAVCDGEETALVLEDRRAVPADEVPAPTPG